jgi:putative addiction module killer protein
MQVIPREIRIFETREGKAPFIEWVHSLSVQHRARVFARLDRVETGNLGDHRSVGEEVFEMRLHFGSGYRVYFGQIGTTIILLLCGGDKSSQKKDMTRAKQFWQEYLSRRAS